MNRRNVKVHADIVTAGARHPPFVAEQGEPFRGSERAAGCSCNRENLIGRVLREIVATAIRVAEDVRGAGGERGRLVATLEHAALLRPPTWCLEADRNCPERRRRWLCPVERHETVLVQ